MALDVRFLTWLYFDVKIRVRSITAKISGIFRLYFIGTNFSVTSLELQTMISDHYSALYLHKKRMLINFLVAHFEQNARSQVSRIFHRKLEIYLHIAKQASNTFQPLSVSQRFWEEHNLTGIRKPLVPDTDDTH